MTKIYWTMIIVAAVLTIGVQYLPHEEGHANWWNHIPGAWLIFGFAGSGLLIGGGRLCARLFTRKPEDYYDA